MKIINVWTRGTDHIAFSECYKASEEWIKYKVYGHTYPIAKEHLVRVIYIVAPAWVCSMLDGDNVARRLPDGRIRVRVENPNKFVLKIVREGFRKDLSLIPVYETM